MVATEQDTTNDPPILASYHLESSGPDCQALHGSRPEKQLKVPSKQGEEMTEIGKLSLQDDNPRIAVVSYGREHNGVLRLGRHCTSLEPLNV